VPKWENICAASKSEMSLGIGKRGTI